MRNASTRRRNAGTGQGTGAAAALAQEAGKKNSYSTCAAVVPAQEAEKHEMTLNQGSGFAGTGGRKEMKGHSTRAEAAPAQGAEKKGHSTCAVAAPAQGGRKKEKTPNLRSGCAGAGGRRKEERRPNCATAAPAQGDENQK